MNSTKEWCLFSLAILMAASTQASDDHRYSFKDHWGRITTVNSYHFNEENLRSLRERKPLSPDDLQRIREITDRSVPYRFARSNRVTWFQYQTPIRNQQNRNTCSIFAMIAAIEARYKRQYGLNLNLSEQYGWHVYKSTGLKHPRKYKYENQSSYWGGGNSHGVKSLVNYVIPLESYAPYKNRGQMNTLRQSLPAAGALVWKSDPSQNTVTQSQVDAFEYSKKYISTAARQNAKYGIASFTLLNQATTRNTNALENLVRAGNEIIVDTNLKWKKNSSTGVMEYNASSSGGMHVFLIVGFDGDKKYFYVKNSWGESTYRKVAYEIFQKESYGGSIVTAVADPNRPKVKSRFLGIWNMDHDGWKGKLIIRRTNNASNSATRLGHYVRANGAHRAVNGYAIDAGRGIKFTIANSQYNTPGQMSGQQFFTDIYSWDVNYASGFTNYNGTSFGLFLNRLGMVAPYGNNFTRSKWLGQWNMNHDGWKGKLKINGFKKVLHTYFLKATYKNASGSTKTVTGYLQPGKEHIAKIKIKFSNTNEQAFSLHYHTWDNNLFSGYTHWSGKRFGVHGLK